MENKVRKKDIAKAYEAYTKQFTPKPPYVKNCLWAFFVGGTLCTVTHLGTEFLGTMGIREDHASSYITIIVILLAQILTGIGIFDSVAKKAGAGVIVPISGFANSMVAPAMEYKKEGLVLGVGSKLFSVAGPVLVCGITAATIVGIVYWLISLL